MRKATAFIAIILAGCTVPAEAQKSKPAQGRESDPVGPWSNATLYVLTPSRLLKAYEENEIAADQLYKNRWVWFVHGATVDKIGRDLLGKPYIILRTTHDARSVQAFFESDSILAQLRPDDRISITGICTGLASNVILEYCAIQPPVRRPPDCIRAEYGCPGGIGYDKEVHVVGLDSTAKKGSGFTLIPGRTMTITQAEIDAAKTEPQLVAVIAKIDNMLAEMDAEIDRVNSSSTAEDKIIAKINAAVVAKDSVAHAAALKELSDLRH
jgi:hypothetical protein